jgi:hypothetical protein
VHYTAGGWPGQGGEEKAAKRNRQQVLSGNFLSRDAGDTGEEEEEEEF